jgi:competence protein ComEA
MRKFLKDFFSFTRSETRIILVLSVLLILFTVGRIYTDTLLPVSYNPTNEEMVKVDEFIASLKYKENIKKEDKFERNVDMFNNLLKFDPNVVLEKDMKDMGFPGNIISNISKFRKAGGHFRKPEEFKKIYGITDSAFLKIKPYIILSDKIRNNLIAKKSISVQKKINISTADSAELLSLKGIGPVLAARIIKYRKKLGGFLIPDQLLDIYGMDSTTFRNIRDLIYADSSNIIKMDINSVSLSELSKHPYSNKYTAASIIKFRDFKTGIKDIKELYTFNIVQKEKLKKIEPYLEVIH